MVNPPGGESAGGESAGGESAGGESAGHRHDPITSTIEIDSGKEDGKTSMVKVFSPSELRCWVLFCLEERIDRILVNQSKHKCVM